VTVSFNKTFLISHITKEGKNYQLLHYLKSHPDYSRDCLLNIQLVLKVIWKKNVENPFWYKSWLLINFKLMVI